MQNIYAILNGQTHNSDLVRWGVTIIALSLSAWFHIYALAILKASGLIENRPGMPRVWREATSESMVSKGAALAFIGFCCAVASGFVIGRP